MTLPGLTLGAQYSFTVAGVDAGGRVGDKSALAQVITFDSKLICTCRMLLYIQVIFKY